MGPSTYTLSEQHGQETIPRPCEGQHVPSL